MVVLFPDGIVFWGFTINYLKHGVINYTNGLYMTITDRHNPPYQENRIHGLTLP